MSFCPYPRQPREVPQRRGLCQRLGCFLLLHFAALLSEILAILDFILTENYSMRPRLIKLPCECVPFAPVRVQDMRHDGAFASLRLWEGPELSSLPCS